MIITLKCHYFKGVFMFSLLEELKKYKPFDKREKKDLNKTLQM